MNNQRGQAVRQLALYNEGILQSLFGNGFVEKSRKGTLTSQETRDANYRLAEYLYSAETAKHVYKNDTQWLDSKYKALLSGTLADQVDLPWAELGMVLVRPELYYARETVVGFLNNKQFRVIDQRTVTLNFEQYWQLYHHGLIDPDSREDFPTRTLSYINQDCRLILFDDPKRRYKQPLSDGFVAEFKGTRGTLQPGTLRGELVINKMFALGVNMPLNSEAALAFDPIQAYRHIIDGTIASDGAHLGAELPFLFYAGVGVHIPEAHELKRDVNVLYSTDELIRIFNEYSNKRNYSPVQ